MERTLSTIVFHPPAWPRLLLTSAAALLVWEVLDMVRWIARRRAATDAAWMALASILAGPLLLPPASKTPKAGLLAARH